MSPSGCVPRFRLACAQNPSRSKRNLRPGPRSLRGLNNIDDFARNFLSEGKCANSFMWAHWLTGSTSGESVEVGSGLIICSPARFNCHSTRFEVSQLRCNIRLMVACLPRVFQAFAHAPRCRLDRPDRRHRFPARDRRVDLRNMLISYYRRCRPRLVLQLNGRRKRRAAISGEFRTFSLLVASLSVYWRLSH
jgi:hypothetical protein